MQRLDHAPLSVYRHGACSRCGRADRLVDIDVLIDYDGSIAMCEGCLGEAAMVAGFIVTERGAQRLADAEAKLAAAESRADEAERTLEQIHASWARVKARRAKESA